LSGIYVPPADQDLLSAVADALDVVSVDSRITWFDTARPSQRLPPEPWSKVYYQGGRGSGKTRAGSQGLSELILGDPEPEGEWGIVAPTYRDAWTVCVEGRAGILHALGTTAGEVKNHTSKVVEYAHRSYGEIGLRNGHVIFVDSADDGALRVQGKNLKGLWGDEIGLWQKWAVAWDESIKYAVRLGQSKIITTGTPKVSRPAAALIRRFLRGDEPGMVIRRLRTIDNIANLSEAFFQGVVALAKGTRLERQELEGELLDDVENALWTRDLLESIQTGEPRHENGSKVHMLSVSVGVDPSDGTEDSDEQAYTVVGKGNDGLLYVLESYGGRIGPAAFAEKAILAAVEWGGQLVVEKNHGGAWLKEVFYQVLAKLAKAGRLKGGRPHVKLVHASLGKRTRAEPAAALYERGLVRHAYGPFVEMEDQMCSFTGAANERSPDRLDSLCWAIQPYLKNSFDTHAVPSAVRRWAAAQELDQYDKPLGDDPRHRRRLARAGGGAYDHEQSGWDLDSFAPTTGDDKGDDRDRPERTNVRQWR
jgi:phage terminase large subunit-like protein